jgi:ATP-dependent DNA helicase DinG
MKWTEAEDRFAEALPGYEPRPQQKLLATTIETALADRTAILGQGGCGVGKSFALLIPVIAYALEHGVTVGVSTATKALQGQYLHNDIPFLQEHLGLPFTAAMVKGRVNYACKAKLTELKAGAIQYAVALREELADPEHTGDVDDIATPLTPPERAKITTGSDECPGKRDCPFGDVCFAEAAKQRGREADLVIVNHASLVTDLRIKANEGQGTLPELGLVGIDEAHELENYATNALGAELTRRGLENLAGEASGLLGAPIHAEVAQLIGAAQGLFEKLKGLIPRNERTGKFDDKAMLACEDEMGDLLDALKMLKQVVADTAPEMGDEHGAVKLKRLKKKINSSTEKLTEIVFANSDQLVRWIEADEKRGVVLKYAPLHVGSFLRENLWDRMPAALVSATLTTSGGSDAFDFIAGRLGIERFESVDAGSPFDFPKQARMLVLEEANPTDKSFWQTRCQIVLKEAMLAAGGRTLALFSSRAAMESMHNALMPSLRRAGLTVMMQGQETVRKLSARFREDETSVLFGLKSFGTGFDVPGDALRVVFIDKMPFPVPSDVIFAARCEAIEKATGDKWASFNKLSVPMMALDLLQEAGRLIRSKSDEGLLIYGDGRLVTKGYGKKILKALPAASRVGTLAEATEYLEELSARRG